MVGYWSRGALLLTVLGLSMPVCLVQAQEGKRDPGVVALLQKHDEAMNQHDLEGVVALFAPSPKTVILGTGPGERYQGLEEIKTAYTHFFEAFDKDTQKRDCYWKDGGGTNKLKWGAVMCKFTDSKAGKKREYELNVSGVLEKEGDHWQFIMVHFSNLTSGAPPPQ